MIVIKDVSGVVKHLDTENPHEIQVPTVPGFATASDVSQGSSSDTIVSPLEMRRWIDSNQPDIPTVPDFATSADVNLGTSKTKIVNPFELKKYVAQQQPTIPSFATDSQISQGTSANTIVSPKGLNKFLDDKLDTPISKHYRKIEFNHNVRIKTTSAFIRTNYYIRAVSLDLNIAANHLYGYYWDLLAANERLSEHHQPLKYSSLQEPILGGIVGLWSWSSAGGVHHIEEDTRATLTHNNSFNLAGDMLKNKAIDKGGIGLTTDEIPVEDPLTDEIFFLDTYEFLVQLIDYHSPGNVNSNLTEPFGEQTGEFALNHIGSLNSLNTIGDSGNGIQSQFGTWTTRIREQLGISVTTHKSNPSDKSNIKLSISIRNARSQKIVRTYILNLAVEVHA